MIRLIDLEYSGEEYKQKLKELFEEDEDTVFMKIQQSTSLKKYFILGFCFNFGIGTLQNCYKAFENWKKDNTPYGHYIIGSCYKRGLGIIEKPF